MVNFLSDAAVRTIHHDLIVEFGGLMGPVNEDMLSSTLARPLNLMAYAGDTPKIAQLAASYGFGFAKNHCFKDGNKRIALVAIDVFLLINGYELIAEEADAVLTIQALAASEISEQDLANWVEVNMRKFDPA